MDSKGQPLKPGDLVYIVSNHCTEKDVGQFHRLDNIFTGDAYCTRCNIGLPTQLLVHFEGWTLGHIWIAKWVRKVDPDSFPCTEIEDMEIENVA